jgi:hypothetical protein
MTITNEVGMLSCVVKIIAAVVMLFGVIIDKEIRLWPGAERDWDERLPIFLLAYRASTHDTTGMAPANMVLGRELRLPCDLLFGAPFSVIDLVCGKVITVT